MDERRRLEVSVTADRRAAQVVRVIEATVSGDTSAISELFTADVVAWSPTVSVSSLVELAVELEDHEETFSEVEVDAGPFVSVGQHVCAEWVATATHSGLLALVDGRLAEPTGRRVTVHGATVADFEGDRICSVRHYWDELEILSELGVLPEV